MSDVVFGAWSAFAAVTQKVRRSVVGACSTAGRTQAKSVFEANREHVRVSLHNDDFADGESKPVDRTEDATTGITH